MTNHTHHLHHHNHHQEDEEQPTPLRKTPSHLRRTVEHSSNGDDQTQQLLPLPPFRPNEDAPKSRGLPLTMPATSSSQHPPTKKNTTSTSTTAAPDLDLLHPLLHKIPLQFRFGFNGILCNVLFMVVYNWAVTVLHETLAPSTVYSVVYFFFIPLGHAMAALIVFGWPERYLASLLSNFPIGLTAIALGSGLTAYLDRVQFNERIQEYIRDNFTFSQMPVVHKSEEEERLLLQQQQQQQQEEAATAAASTEFYSSLVVLVVTSVWTYVLSVYINSPPTKSDKKEQ